MKKTCVTCKIEKHTSEFHRLWKGLDARGSNCVTCHNARQREYARRCRARKKSEAPPRDSHADWRSMASELARGDLKGKPLSIHVRVGSPSFKAVVKHLVESGLLDNPERWTDP